MSGFRDIAARAARWCLGEVKNAWLPLVLFHALLAAAFICGERTWIDPLETAFAFTAVFPVTLFIAGAGRILGNGARWLHPALFAYIYAMTVADIYSYIAFRIKPGGELVGILYSTSWEEIRHFLLSELGLGSFKGIAFAVLFAVPPVACGALLARRRYAKCSLRGLAAGVAMCTPFLVSEYAIGTDIAGEMAYFRIPRSCAAQYTFYAGIGEASAHPDLPDSLSPETAPGAEPVVVFAIGESATRNRMSLYGYARETTPAMDARSARGELVVFRDMLASAFTTARAVSFLCTGATLENPGNARWTLCAIARRAGYRTALFSMHQPFGLANCPELSLFSECDELRWSTMEFMKKGINQPDFEKGSLALYDDSVTSACIAELDGHPEGRECVFVHFYGSHFAYAPRTPPAEKVFRAGVDGLAPDEARRERESAEYDNSIRYTDKQIERIIARLEKDGRPSALFYISDHGESPELGKVRVTASRSVWEIPAFVWFSPSYREAYPDTVEMFEKAAGAPLQSDQLMPGLCELLRVRDLRRKEPEADFLSPRFKIRKPRAVPFPA